MLKKTLSYIDYNGNETSEDLYFHLSPMEIVRIQAELQLGDGQELDTYALKLAESKDLKAMLTFIDMIVQKSYGVRSSDGKHFDKSESVLKELISSPKYDALIENLLFVEGSVQEFASGIGMLGDKLPKKPELKVVEKSTPEELLAKLQADPILMQKLLDNQ